MERLVFNLNHKQFGTLLQVHFAKMYLRRYTQHSLIFKINSQCKQVTLLLQKAQYSIYDLQRPDHMSSLMTYINRYPSNLILTIIGSIEKLITCQIGSLIQVALKKHQFSFQGLSMLFFTIKSQKTTWFLSCLKQVQMKTEELLYQMVQIAKKLLTSVKLIA